ncbi:MAG: HdeD family acid-resistance protein [Rhodospirillaceae bacterium]
MGQLREAVSSWAQTAAKNAGWIMVLGIVTVVAGFLAMGSPLAAGLTVVVLIGIALVIGGVARIIGAFSAGSFGQGTLAFIGGMITFVAGLALTGRPGIGLTTLTLMLGVLLVVDGISNAILAFKVRPEKGWGSMLFSAVMGVLLGFLLLREWPLSGTWAIGTLVGVNLVFSGFSMISIGSAGRSVAKKLS